MTRGSGGNGRLGYDNTTAQGDTAGDMAALPAVNLGTGRTAGPVARVGVTVTADQTQVVAGQDIDCAADIADLAPGAVTTYPCTHTTTGDDVPQMTNQVLVTTAQGVFALSGTRRTRVDAQVFRPDAQIRVGAGAFAGDGTYNTTEAFTVKGLGTTTRYTVTYENGPTNITATVVAGTFTTAPLAPGAIQDLTLTIKAKAGTPVGNAITRTTTITSVTAPTIKDAVKATVTRG